MKSKITFFLRNIAKMVIQNCILPVIYEFEKLLHKEKNLYVFADAHHTSLPFSLEVMYNHICAKGIEPVCHFYDYTHEGAFKSFLHSVKFMSLYARAKYVFICDTFVPVSSGKKHKDTKVVQLCHFSGPLKKIGYATEDDIPAYYGKNVFKNYSLVSVSAPMYEEILTKAMLQKDGVVKALGSSRSDIYFDNEWIDGCKEEFYSAYPEARNKKVLLWAPTFRGDASLPNALDNQSFFELQEKLGEDWLVLIKHHPHDDAVAVSDRYRSNCSIPSERLLPVVDLLVSDYSTTMLDYLTFQKPFVLFAPDLEQYEAKRGFFIDYRSITKNLVTEKSELYNTVKKAYEQWLSGDREDILLCKERFTKCCDGNSTERILDYLERVEHNDTY